MSIRIVLADDHVLLREALKSLLDNESDIEVVGEADNGRHALEVVRNVQPDILILDIAMPELNGMDTAHQMRARFPEVHVIALSGHYDQRHVLAMLKAGVAGYMVKIQSVDQLGHAIRVVASGRKYLCPQAADAVMDDMTNVAQTSAAAVAALSHRENEVLQLVAEGFHSIAIADKMFISVHTVETHRRNIMRKLDLHSVAELTKFAIREGLTQA
jgi:two-component system, NarL family, response regulator NreC